MTTEPTLEDLLAEPPERRILCGRPLPPWSELLARAGIPEPPGYAETLAFRDANR